MKGKKWFNELNEGCSFPENIEGYWRRNVDRISEDDSLPFPIAMSVPGYNRRTFYNQLMEGLDSSNLIRESGGYALSAGEFSNLSQRLNGFAIGNRYGVHTVSLNVLMGSNWDFLETYRQNYDQMVEATANGILGFIGIEP